jgi:hypothetical protein
MHPSRRLTIAAAAVVALLATACGGSDSSSGDSSGSSDNSGSIASPNQGVDDAPEESAGPVGSPVPDDSAVAESAPSGLELTPICDTIPSLEEISAILAAAVTTTEDLSSTVVMPAGVDQVITDKCEATSESSASVTIASFERFDLVSGQGIITQAKEQGLEADFASGDLPGAFAWANGLMIEDDGVYLYATAITELSLTSPDSPAIYEMSAALLKAWLAT